MKSFFSTIKYSTSLPIYVVFLFIFSSCGSSTTDEKPNTLKKDTITTDQTEMLEIEDVEMESMYEVTNTKTDKKVLMSQEEYLESSIWENPDCIVKEIPMVK